MIRLRVGRLELRADAGFFGVFCLFWELGGMGDWGALAVLAAVLLHEGGHLAAYCRAGIPVRMVSFDCRGVQIRPEPGIYPFSHELTAVLAGSGTGLFWAGVSALLPLPALFPQASAALALWSLLPLSGMDGGEAVELLVSRFRPGAERGLRIFFLFTRTAATLLIAAGCVAAQNPLPLFWAACLWL